MTDIVKPEDVPSVAHNAAFDVHEKRGGSMSAAIAAALNAWPSAKVALAYPFADDRPDEWIADTQLGEHGDDTFPVIILPLEKKP